MKRLGRPPHPEVLTPRQQEVLELLREGQTNEQIARELGISPDGAKFHVSEILGRLGVTSRSEAAQWLGQPERSGAPSVSLNAAMPRLRLRTHPTMLKLRRSRSETCRAHAAEERMPA